MLRINPFAAGFLIDPVAVQIQDCDMKEPEDLVWDAITDSAKRKFDYEVYKINLGSMGDNNITDNIIIIVIVGHVAGHSNEKIAELINQELVLLGIGFSADSLADFLKNKKAELKDEIHAADVALTLLNRGAKVPGVLVQVKSMLKMF